MFGGKTGRLIDVLEEAEREGRTGRAYRPWRDTRDGRTPFLTTYDERKYPATLLETTADIVCPTNPRLVAVDEANMWDTSELVAAVDTLLARGHQVHVAGLDRDWRGLPFEPMPTLLIMAHVVESIPAKCSCGREAWYSQRIVDCDDLIHPGGAGEYAPRCVLCFRSPNATNPLEEERLRATDIVEKAACSGV